MVRLRWAWFGLFVFAFIVLSWMFRYDWVVSDQANRVVALDRWTGEIVILFGERYALVDVPKGSVK